MIRFEPRSLSVGPGSDREAPARSSREATCHAQSFKSSNLIHSFRMSSSNWSLMDLQRSKVPQSRLWVSLSNLVIQSQYSRNWVFTIARLCNGGGTLRSSSSEGLQKTRSSMWISWSNPDQKIDRQASKEWASVSSWEVTLVDWPLLWLVCTTGSEVAVSWGGLRLGWCISGDISSFCWCTTLFRRVSPFNTADVPDSWDAYHPYCAPNTRGFQASSLELDNPSHQWFPSQHSHDLYIYRCFDAWTWSNEVFVGQWVGRNTW